MQQQTLLAAKQLLSQSSLAVLSTLSKAMPGYPFGSTVHFISDASGGVYLFISDLAQHTKNLSLSPKLSLTVFASDLTQTADASRLTLLADAKKLAKADSQSLIEQFVQQIPSASQYAQLADFYIWQLDIVRVRFISGFGEIFWLEKDQWHIPNELE
ncbi:HugZ family protein [Pseudoalteromonas byunsanensis]|uniref:Pyridoxamine 5'-phosphate oxidase n=1 Tax=Pseudoalteromonas byunsanensis TaxID=327939 RepID=A0A1S1N504_9GAMM|nr:pyridoxamine 5'-phosphate oxidase family protein [Pseudoalteromonas byunsanensis]OHU95076.1 pyridoxamine 5'-phosphate oxidase [Pseudoalteromonas byunsanensis]